MMTLAPAFIFGGFPAIGLIGLLLTIFWIWMLIDAITNEPSTGNDKIIWILIIIFTGFIGALIYYFVRKQNRR